MNNKLQNYLNFLCCGDSIVLPEFIGEENTVSSGTYQYNFDTGQLFQIPSDSELIAYTTEIADLQDSDFRTKRDAYFSAQTQYLIAKFEGKNSYPITNVPCRPDNIGKFPSKAQFFDIPFLNKIKETTFGFPYDITFLPEVATIADLPTTGNQGDARNVVSESGYYFWNASSNAWGISLIENINGVPTDVNDLLSTSRALRDNHMRNLSEMLFASTFFTWANDYLPSFQVTNFKL